MGQARKLRVGVPVSCISTHPLCWISRWPYREQNTGGSSLYSEDFRILFARIRRGRGTPTDGVLPCQSE
ncbi:hypothetical protein SeMB42_g07137 [Synchytrium endobioticum]|uniref:Uncharacterized protein n=1 Tax=Synchytrium endobioticum TaxID=286115 RepID=A0A507C2T6_9FUNG|nr:hypothetical protein SeMB42_g07137 [Synchytrium endobioticum]